MKYRYPLATLLTLLFVSLLVATRAVQADQQPSPPQTRTEFFDRCKPVGKPGFFSLKNAGIEVARNFLPFPPT